MTRALFLAAAAVAALATTASAQSVFVVRHAERADAVSGGSTMMAADPELSDAGRARAQSLAAVLKDAGITAIYTTEYKRTQQTAAPLAQALGVQVTVVSSKDMPALIDKIRGAAANVLVVGHSNTVGEVIGKLGVPETVTLTDKDYDNLFVVVKGEKPTLIRLHFR